MSPRASSWFALVARALVSVVSIATIAECCRRALGPTSNPDRDLAAFVCSLFVLAAIVIEARVLLFRFRRLEA